MQFYRAATFFEYNIPQKYSNLSPSPTQLHQVWRRWLQNRPAAIVTRLGAYRRDVESPVKVSSEGGRHQTTPYCRNRRRHCARAGVERACPCSSCSIYAVCRAVAPAPPASTISQHSAAVAATWSYGGFRDAVVLKSGVAAVSRRGWPAVSSTCPLYRQANFWQSSGCIEIKFCSSYPHSFAGARFSISLAIQGDPTQRVSKFARDRSGQVAEFSFRFLFSDRTIVVFEREVRSPGMFSCYAPMYEKDWRTLKPWRGGRWVTWFSSFLCRCSTLWIYISFIVAFEIHDMLMSN